MRWKEAYQEKVDSQLKEWKAQIDQFAAQPLAIRYGKSVNRERAVERLSDAYQAAKARIDELKTAASERWDEAKNAVEQAMIDLKRVLDETGAARMGEVLQVHKKRDHIYEPFRREE